ncbi:MAG TPA: response regulator [Candidatus Deferrimicrobium sp.]|nr:response regulator [Candidatus Deferrimicrobium sp.]
MRILIIDDDEVFLRQMEKNLSLEQYSAYTAVSGEKALLILKENEMDLILMDLKMPGLSGVNLIQKIREIDCNSIIIMITGYGTIESAVQTMKAGAYDYILKPFNFPILLEKIKEVELELKLRKKIAVAESLETLEYEDFLTLKNLNEYESPFLIISDENPSKIIHDLNISKCYTIWLSHNVGEDTVAPTKLYSLIQKIENFVEKNEKGTIILKGIEELLEIHKWDDFKRFLIYLQSEILSKNFLLILLLKKGNHLATESYKILLHDALSVLINPVFNKIIEILSHSLRKSIINLLQTEKDLNFNKIINKLNIKHSSSLAFHLNKLVQESIIEKEEAFYSLTSRGSYIAEVILLLEKMGFSDPSSQVKILTFSEIPKD